jgi:hypothetical protein
MLLSKEAGRSQKLLSLPKKRRCAMQQSKVPVPADVMEGLEAVRLSGKTNMLDAPMVQRLAYEMDYFETVLWIEEHPDLYRIGIFVGFETIEGGDS